MCANELLGNSASKFIDKSRKVHGNKYDYSKVKYKNYVTDVIIICPIHGEFKQKPKNHVNGGGCKECAYDRFSYNTDCFIGKARRVHGDKYDYSKTRYKNTRTKLIIICPDHGEFVQYPSSHLGGNGCKKCHIEETRSNTEDFIKKARKIHGNKYDYSKSEYTRAFDDITIVCPKHGEFIQKPNTHLNNEGCPGCGTIISKQHNKIIKCLDGIVDFEINNRSAINPFELDIYVPSHNFAVEVHGIYWHSEFDGGTSKKYKHYDKYEMCRENGIRLVQIFEDEIINKYNIIKSEIKKHLGLLHRVCADNCYIDRISNQDYMEFINSNHINGYKPASIRYGLIHNNELVCVMSFSKHGKFGWEVVRHADMLGVSVVGGTRKLFREFINNNNVNIITACVDRRFSNGELYKGLGFDLHEITKPSYYYVKGSNVYSRTKFQKHKLNNTLEVFDRDLSEAQNMFNNGYRRIWDAGHYRFLWSK